MSDFFDRVVGRARGAERIIQPLIASRYAQPEQRLASMDASGEAHGPADANAADNVAVAAAPHLAETTPDDSTSRSPRAPRDVPPRGVDGDVENESPGGAPRSSPPRPAVAPVALHEEARSAVPRRPPPIVEAEAAPAPPTVEAPLAATNPLQPRRRDVEARTERSGADRTVPATIEAEGARSAAAPSPSEARAAITGGRDEGSAERARALLAGIYEGPADVRATAAAPATSTLDPGSWSGATARESDGRTEQAAPREITIAIDRIDVRGLAPPRPEPRGRRGPRVGLHEYMQQHGRAKR